MSKYRLLFSKTGRSVYISHLDLMKVMSRAFLRADCGLKFSEGFNPRPQISLMLPLSVGCGSMCEIMDFVLETDIPEADILALLSEQLPEGIEPVEAYRPERKAKELKWLRVNGVFEYDDGSAASKCPELNGFFSSDSIVISKKTKRGISDTDIKPAIRSIALEESDGAVSLDAVISAQEPTLNPELLADALRQLRPELAPDFAKFMRIEVFDEEMNVFR